jgi:hypothetical protein
MVGIARAISWRTLIVVAMGSGALHVPAPARAAPQTAVNPVLSFTNQAVTASGMTPGGRVVWFGVMREINQGAADWSDLETITADAGGAGSVQLDLGKPVPPRSSSSRVCAILERNLGRRRQSWWISLNTRKT